MPRKKSTAIALVSKQGTGIAVQGPIRLQSDAEFMRGTSQFSDMPVEVRQPYAKHAWVHAGVRAIASNAGGVPIQIKVGDSKNQRVVTDEDEGPEGQLASLFARPNEFDTSYQYMEKTFAIMNLDGWCVWLLERKNITEIPLAMYALRPNGFEPVIHPKTKRMLGWIQQAPDGQVHAYDTSQVIVSKFFNPYDPIKGLSPLEAAQRGIRLDIYAAAYSEMFFYNSADPAGVITSEKKLSETQAKQIVSWWENRHRGPGSAKQIGILYGGMKWQTTASSHKDMEFNAQLNWNRDEILAVLKVPKSELLINADVNHSIALSGDRAFWQKTLIPQIRNVESSLKANFIPGLRGTVDKNLKIVFDLAVVPALQGDFNEKVKNAEILARIGYPVNAINERLEMGMPRVDWGDVWYTNRAIASIDQILEGDTAGAKPSGPTVPGPDTMEPMEPVEPEDAPDPDRPEPEKYLPPFYSRGVSTPNTLSNPHKFQLRQKTPKTPRLSYSELRDQVLEPISKLYKEELRAFLYRLRSHQLSITAKGDSFSAFDFSTWKNRLEFRTKPIHDGLVKALEHNLHRKTNDCDSSIEHWLLAVHTAMHCTHSAQPKTERLSRLKEVFNSLADHEKLMVVVKNEVGRVMREVEKGLIYEAQAV